MCSSAKCAPTLFTATSRGLEAKRCPMRKLWFASDRPWDQESSSRRIVNLACEHKVIRGGRLRVDTTVVETNVHYPTDSSLLADGARVLRRTMKRVRETVGGLKT